MADSENSINKLLALVIVSALAGTGGSLGFRAVDNPRPDPFTGTQGRELENRSAERDRRQGIRIDKLEREIEIYAEHQYQHEQEANGWKHRIIRLEEKIK